VENQASSGETFPSNKDSPSDLGELPTKIRSPTRDYTGFLGITCLLSLLVHGYGCRKLSFNALPELLCAGFPVHPLPVNKEGVWFVAMSKVQRKSTTIIMVVLPPLLQLSLLELDSVFLLEVY
jgi:hypothetical protein